MAHIQKRMRNGKKRWVLRWRPFPGSPVEQSRTFGTKGEAEAALRRILAGDPDLRGDRRTFQEAFDKWMAIRDHRLKENTRHLEHSYAERYVLPKWGGMPVARIRADDLEEWLAGFYREGRLSDSTINLIWRLTSAPLRYAAERWDWIAKNPARGISPKAVRGPKVTTPPRILQRWEVEAIANAIDSHYRPMIVFMAGTGARVGEVAALRVGDVERGREYRVSIRRTLREVNGKQVFGVPKTPASVRTIVLPDELRETIDQLVEGRSADELLFVTKTGKPLRMTNTRKKVWAPAVRAAGVSWCTIHDLRHFHASVLLGAGVPLEIVSKRLGHADQGTTAKTYAHLLEGHDEDAARAYSQAMKGPMRDGTGSGVLHFPTNPHET